MDFRPREGTGPATDQRSPRLSCPWRSGFSPWSCPGEGGEGSLAAGTAPPLGSREARKAAGWGSGEGGWGQEFDSASLHWEQPAVGRWLSLGCSPLSLPGCGMTPPPPGCASLGAPRARVPGRLARSWLLLQLLLLLWTAAATQGHQRSGPRISAVWKGRWRRAAGGERERTPRGAGAECAAPEGVRALRCGSRAVPAGSVWVWVSV